VLLKKYGKIYVVAPYNPEFVNALKEGIPWHARKWDGDAKHWAVSADYQMTLETIAADYFDFDVAVTESTAQHREEAARAQRPPDPPRASSGHTTAQCLAAVRHIYAEEAALGVFPPADSEPLIRAVYRAKALLAHPDIVGASAHDAMVTLNRAYDTLLKRCKRVAS
jgi:hypothetical protein